MRIQRSRNIQLKYKIDIMNYDKLKESQKKETKWIE